MAVVYTLESVFQMLQEHGEKAKEEERERILGLIDKEIEDWKQGKWWQDYNEGAIKSLAILRKLVADVKEEVATTGQDD